MQTPAKKPIKKDLQQGLHSQNQAVAANLVETTLGSI